VKPNSSETGQVSQHKLHDTDLTPSSVFALLLLKLSSAMAQEKVGKRRGIFEKNGGEVKIGMSVSHI